VRDALEASRRRFERDRERGVPAEETAAFVAERLAPLAEAHAAAGLAFEPGALLAEAAGDASPTLEP
jgi:hypothetical protein